MVVSIQQPSRFSEGQVIRISHLVPRIFNGIHHKPQTPANGWVWCDDMVGPEYAKPQAGLAVGRSIGISDRKGLVHNVLAPRDRRHIRIAEPWLGRQDGFENQLEGVD